jgi:hypothetical protein
MIMANPILLDTDVLVDFLRGHNKAVVLVNDYSYRIILSSIVIAELYAGINGEDEQVALDKFVSLFRVIPVNTEIAKAGGFYKRQFDRSHGIGLAAANIPASVEVKNAELKALNIRRYAMIKGLAPAYKK